MGPADPFGEITAQPPAESTIEPIAAPALPAPAAGLDRLGFGLGILFGLMVLLVGLPGALLVMGCGLGGALLGGLASQRQRLLRWIADAAQRAM